MSKPRISKEFKIGLAVIVIIGLGYFGANYLKGINLFQDQKVFHSVYQEAEGLNVSDPVMLNGKRIGQVKSVEFTEDFSGKVTVEFLINIPEFPIPVDTKAIIKSDLLGSHSVDIILGKSEILAVDGDPLVSGVDLSMTEEFRKELEPLKVKTQELIGGIDEIVTNIQSVFEDDPTLGLPKIFESLANTLDNLETTTLKVNGVIDENSDKLSMFMNNINGIADNFNGNNEKLNNVITNFSSISDSLAQLEVKQTMNKVNTTLAQLDEVMTKINEGDGSMGLLLNNDTLHNSLVNTNTELQLLVDDIYQNPWRYLHISIFGKKQEKKYSKKELKQLREIIDETLEDPEP